MALEHGNCISLIHARYINMTYGNIFEGNTTTVLAGRQEVILFVCRFFFNFLFCLFLNKCYNKSGIFKCEEATKILKNDSANSWRSLDLIKASEVGPKSYNLIWIIHNGKKFGQNTFWILNKLLLNGILTPAFTACFNNAKVFDFFSQKGEEGNYMVLGYDDAASS